jgi:hypothetical protein
MKAGFRWVAVLLSSVLAAFSPIGSQTPPQPLDTVAPRPDTGESRRIVWLVDDYAVMRARVDELNGAGPAFPIFRSTSHFLWSNRDLPDGVRPIPPLLQLVSNSALPYSRNEGGLWAGRGTSLRIGGGVAAKIGRLRIVLAPELLSSQNDSFPPRTEAVIPSPTIPPDRSRYSFPWYANGPYSIDMPLRFGSKSRGRLSPGQSSILGDFGAVSFGLSTENEWWGPGVDNALVLSDNAPGFPHLLFASAHPLETRLGNVEFRWLVGGLTTSAFFDTATNRNSRSISSAAVALKPRGLENLSIGVARSVIGTSTGWSEIPFRWLEVFHNTGHPNQGAPYDSTLHPGGRDQIYSLFARWVLPASGVEIYGEWGRLDFPRNLRDLLVQPNRGAAYTMGLQWTRQAFTPTGRFHFRIENTSLEQSLAQRERFAGVWYTSRRVLEGFTNEGQVLGAAVGPGSSGQAVEMNFLARRGYFGIEFGRTRYNEDVRQASPMLEYLRWCSHDVALQWGFHGGFRGPLGSFSVRSQSQNRLNAWFQSGYGCPRSDRMVDLRNNNFSITFSPPFRW